MNIIAIANQKGGISKTTSAINIAYYLAQMGNKTLLIDLDPQASATSGLNIRNQQFSVYDLFYNKSFEEVVCNTDYENLKILPSHQNLAAFESEGILIERKEKKLKDILSEINDKFDFIIIDCPSSLGLLTINALVSCDYVIIPVQTEFFALEGLGLIIETIAKVKKKLNKKIDILGILLTMCDKRNNLHKEVIHDVKLHFEKKVFQTHLRRNVKLAESVSFGKVIEEYDKKSISAFLYKEIVNEMLSRLYAH